jgi:hypothetical protein
MRVLNTNVVPDKSLFFCCGKRSLGSLAKYLTILLLSACAVQPTAQRAADTARHNGPTRADAAKNRGTVLPLRNANALVLANASIGKHAIDLNRFAQADQISRQRIDPPRANGFSLEPSMAAYHANGTDHLVIGWHHVTPGATRDTSHFGSAVSHDSGQSWLRRIYTQFGNLGAIHFDPFTAADAQSAHLWLGGLARRAPDQATSIIENGMFLVQSQGQSALSDGRVIDTDADDKPAAVFAPSPQSANGTLFIAGREAHRRSADLGQSFQRRLSGGGEIGHQPVIFPDGQIVVVATRISFGAPSVEISASTSTDSGASFSASRTVRVQNYSTLATLDASAPGQFRMVPFGQLALGPGGTLYYVFPEIVGISGGERNVDVLLIKSTDRGQSWSTPVVVNGDSAVPRDQFMPALAVGPDGAVHVAYLDTRRSQQPDASTQIQLDVVYARSIDGGQSFSEVFLTDSAFDASAIAWRAYSNDFEQYFLGDYLAIVAPSEAVYIAYPQRAADADQIGLMLATLRFGAFANGFEAVSASRLNKP